MSVEKKSVGLIYGPEAHHLDHLAVICALMEIPLVVTEEEIAASARKYYPRLEVIHWDYGQVAQNLVKNFQIVFYCMPRLLFDEVFFFAQKLLNKRLHTIWCPHGNSDKGHASLFMEALEHEEIALIYGKKMIDLLMHKKVFEQLRAFVVTGNYRYTFYEREKSFYTQQISRELSDRLKPAQKTLLFAPTWQDSEKSSSFFDACPILAKNLPDHYNLIVKLHPNLAFQGNGKTEEIISRYEDKQNILFLFDFPPVYPLLDFVDIYIGDMSSIGYDFLTFDKPMFFLNQNNRDSKSDLGLYLYRCGVEIKREEYPQIYSIIALHLPSDNKDFSEIRREVYAYTFGKEKQWDTLRQEILDTYKTLPDEELDFFV